MVYALQVLGQKIEESSQHYFFQTFALTTNESYFCFLKNFYYIRFGQIISSRFTF